MASVRAGEGRGKVGGRRQDIHCGRGREPTTSVGIGMLRSVGWEMRLFVYFWL
jgi:hypothetical protein